MYRIALVFVLSFVCQATTAETNADKLRKALDATKELEIDAVGLTKVVEQLSAQTSVPFIVDVGMFPSQLPGALAPGGLSDLVVLKLRGTYKVGETLNRSLAPHSLTHVIVGDRVYITTVDRAVTLQVRQRISVALDGVPLSKALAHLANDTGVNIVVDPQMKKEAETTVAVKLNDTSLEVAVTVLASSAGMRAVRLDNVIFVTSPTKAAGLREDAPSLDTPKPLVQPFGLTGGVGAIGGLNVLGGFGNLGGQFGQMGGTGVPRPVGMGIIGTPPPAQRVQPMIDPATGVPMRK